MVVERVGGGGEGRVCPGHERREGGTNTDNNFRIYLIYQAANV